MTNSNNCNDHDVDYYIGKNAYGGNAARKPAEFINIYVYTYV